MAYQARGRAPIFDSTTQALIERRGKELIGLALLALAVAFALLIGSYSPDDPGMMAAGEGPTHNLLGSVGAAIASPLAVIIGKAAWGIVVALGVWGLRLVAHFGEDRALPRALFVPIPIALGAAYASTLDPVPGWNLTFGLGGLFGDTFLGALMAILPVSSALGLKLLAVVFFFATLAAGGFALGVDRRELDTALRYMTGGTVLLYAGLMSFLGHGVRGAARRAALGAATGAEALKARAAERKAERAARAEEEGPGFAAPPPLKARRAVHEEPPMSRTSAGEPQRPGLLARVGLARRANEPAEPCAEAVVPDGSDGCSERISAKIANALRARTAPVAGPAEEPAAPVSAVSAAVARAAARSRIGGAPADVFRHEPPVQRDETPVAEDALWEPDAGAGFSAEAPHQPEMPPAPREMSLPPAPEPEPVVQHSRRRAAKSTRAIAEAQPSLNFGDQEAAYELPPLGLLADPASVERHHLSDEALEENARMLETVLDDYGVKGEIVSVRPGPVVTMYELEPAPGLKASRVIGLADDIARSMSALSARVSTVPGRSVIGIELPNAHREKVVLREILSARDFGDTGMVLPLALGKDIGGGPVVANLAKMPHLLIAGTTGSGKSVAINTMILSLLYRLGPDECRLIMIDPKMLELSVYDGIPHLLSPVVTDPKKAVVALKWVVGEMEERYRKMSKMGVRNIEGYNGRVAEALGKGEMFSRTVQTGFDEESGEPVFETEEFAPEKLPYIVVVVDEMADLMMVAGKEIEAAIQRLAQMARASGIHLIMATQRPSVDVITGTIKANFPTRISFQVTSKVDSRTILGEQGAEQLLGMGDMLYMAGGGRLKRVHGPFVSDEEVEEIVSYLKSFGAPDYVSGVVEGPDSDRAADIDAVLGLDTGGNTNAEDALYDQAVAIVIKDRKCSTSYIQRKLGIGYNKAARLVERMEDEGLVSASNHVGKREILVPEQA
ncbi:MAG: cell division protein FtsK [Rhodobacterales bacterium]|nr:MAG: cell division protein FtsK [Rhodobacterales bacterium]